VASSQEIYQAVRQLRKNKKVVVSMGSIAASGGYLIATAADRIMANPGTITGSISAVMHFANVEELLKKVGVRASVVKSGKFKDIGSPTREMTPEERELVQVIVNDIYDQFVTTVSENRKIPLEKVVKLSDGRIFSGRQALDLDLVDELGGLQDAILLAGRLAGIKGKPAIAYGVKKRTSLWKYLLENMASILSEKIGLRTVETPGIHYLFE
jgi:protease-4